MIRFFRPVGGLLKGWLCSLPAGFALAIALTAMIRTLAPLPWSIVSVLGVALLPWALLAPLVFRLADRMPIEGGKWKRTLPVYLAVGVAVALLVVAGTPALKIGLHPVTIDVPPTVDDVRKITARSPANSGDWSAENAVSKLVIVPSSIQKIAWREWSPGLGTAFGLNFTLYLGLLGIAHLWVFYRSAQTRQREAAELSANLAKARLHALRMQIHPHFLFNSLNALGNLIRRSPDAADEMLVSLCSYLRRTLDAADEPEVPLGRELESARVFLEIEKVRFEERLSFAIDAPPDTHAARVPDMLLQPLVENAVRHGIEPKPGGGTVRISARREGTALRIAVSDDGAGIRHLPPREGIGLTNCRARLRELHGDSARLDISSRGDGTGVTVTVELPWRT